MQQFTPGKCLNCEAVTPNPRALYCGERCRQIAELVRYARRKLAEGTYDRPDIAEAIFNRRSQLVRGFYNKRARQVTPEARQELLARSMGRCEKCGCDFMPEGDSRFTVQHTVTDKGMVLEAWCYRCNMGHAQSVLIPTSYKDRVFLIWFDSRVRAPQPILLCDDADNWPAIERQLRVHRSRSEPHPRRSRSRTEAKDVPTVNPDDPHIIARERVEALIRARPPEELARIRASNARRRERARRRRPHTGAGTSSR